MVAPARGASDSAAVGWSFVAKVARVAAGAAAVAEGREEGNYRVASSHRASCSAVLYWTEAYWEDPSYQTFVHLGHRRARPVSEVHSHVHLAFGACSPYHPRQVPLHHCSLEGNDYHLNSN